MRSTAAFMMALLLLLSPSAQEARGAPARCWRAPAVPCGPVLRGGDGASSCDSDLEALLDAASSGSSDARAGQQGMRGTRQARPPRPAAQPPPVPPVAAHQTVPHVAAAPREPQPCARGAAEREPRAPGGLGRPSEEHSSSSELPPSTSADRASESEVADTPKSRKNPPDKKKKKVKDQKKVNAWNKRKNKKGKHLTYDEDIATVTYEHVTPISMAVKSQSCFAVLGLPSQAHTETAKWREHFFWEPRIGTILCSWSPRG